MDLKEMYCERADELAEQIYGKEFYDLPDDIQDKVWLMAERGVVEDCADYADFLRDKSKDDSMEG